jgi:transposase InsO family protein
VIGWHLSESLEAKNTIKALLMAIQTAGGGNLCGTIHHSDRGSQYACNEYVECLKLHHIQISMTERYNPTDNPIAERQNGILKTEWIYQQEIYANYETALYEIGNAIDAYNNIRPHMSIGYKRPMEVYLGSEPGPNLWKKNKKV